MAKYKGNVNRVRYLNSTTPKDPDVSSSMRGIRESKDFLKYFFTYRPVIGRFHEQCIVDGHIPNNTRGKACPQCGFHTDDNERDCDWCGFGLDSLREG